MNAITNTRIQKNRNQKIYNGTIASCLLTTPALIHLKPSYYFGKNTQTTEIHNQNIWFRMDLAKHNVFCLLLSNLHFILQISHEEIFGYIVLLPA